ncbi:hypothetical protein E6W39_20190 [Kitasatospora acidiphila]|uniref:DUF5302 domain-containing protein n=1 Tax=Kitasatospora acidiphila TaxID=2567942 RepID=A0A540W538_9ACTN|nr:DUF5302 domain-containing protein [Kitasatospora acidiphila]TQF04126.1 hypothetical protein E6W39_20190 [Kitasatospora acidiphila]
MNSTEPSAAEHEEGSPAPEAAPDSVTDADDTADTTDVKAKFLAALQQKKGSRGDGAGGGPGGNSKIHSTHGAAGGKRTFRRKSGG